MRPDYVVKRFGMFLLIVWLAATVNFFLPRLGGQNPARLPKEPISRRCELDVPPDAAQEVHFQLGFEIANLLAQGRLGGVQAVRRAAEMELFGDRHEVAQVPQLHSGFLFIRSDVSKRSRSTMGSLGAAGHMIEI